MEKFTLIYGDAAAHSAKADMIFTDPPYDMPASTLASILDRYDASHLILITTMRQLIEFTKLTDWRLAFDFVIDGVAPKKSRNVHQPNYIHQTGVYMTKPGVSSVFNRKHRQRSDVFEGNGYWPTIFYAPRHGMKEHGMAKNQNAITDILGSFEVGSVIDPFAGSGTTALAAFELGMSCTIIEKNAEHIKSLKSKLAFIECLHKFEEITC